MTKTLNKLLLAAIMLLSATSLFAQDNSSLAKYMPTISGVMRGRWEMQTTDGTDRFAVRNARLTVSGNIIKPIDYYFRTDFCDMGKLKVLDYWMRLSLTNDLKIKVGQFRVPFGHDSFRGPGTYYFANRSFMGRYVANLRAVGVSLSYNFREVPLLIEAGVFNPTEMADHSAYTSDKLFAAKATYTIDNVKIIGGFESLIPDDIRINMYDAAISYTCGRWLVEGEYIYKHYTNSAFDACNSFNVFANYAIPVKLSVFNQLSLQARWDYSDDHSSGKRNAEGFLIANQPKRQRITLGSQLTYKVGKVHCDIHLNYEKFFYEDGVTAPEGRDDKIVAELVVAF